MKRSEAIRFFRRVFALSCFGLFFIVFCLLIQMKYIVMANTQDSVGRRHETAQHSTAQTGTVRCTLGASSASLAALLIYIVDFYQCSSSCSCSWGAHSARACQCQRGWRIVVPLPLPRPPTCCLISNTCNECLNCHYHLLARVMFFGCHVSKYCEKISAPTSHEGRRM